METMSDAVLQSGLRLAPWLDPVTWRLPGVQPLSLDDWLWVDDAFDGQMALRDSLINNEREKVHALLPEGADAAAECLDLVLGTLIRSARYRVSQRRAFRPDGAAIDIDRENPLLTIGRLIQEDICLMMRRGDEHVLVGGILCFPASWTLAEKIGKPLTAIDKPVDEYTSDVARRVQRLFDAIRVGRPMWRANALMYEAPDLFSPRLEAEGERPSRAEAFLRSERQVLIRLPKTDAVVFSIHTSMVPIDALDAEQKASLDAVRSKLR